VNLLPGPVSDPETGEHPFIDIEKYVEGARIAETAGFDAAFLSDALAIQLDP
jgi:alkanesulfonate monooxygenase SsuD/methylene tetrahydromethanopterin reductase-like flavin-dependent oxidoreductase (luciferase family)